MERTSNPTLHRLQQTLETGAPREEIAEALRAAEELGDDLPPLLAFRAQERIDADRFLDRRRIAFSVGVALFLFVTGISSVGLTTLMRMRESNRDAADFQQLVDDEKWEEAKTLLAGLSDSDLAKPPFADGQKLVRDAIELEEERAEEFEKLVQEIRTNPALLLDEDTISRLDELAKSDDEKKISSDISAQADEQHLIREAGRVENQTEDFQRLQQGVNEFFQNEAKTLDPQQLADRTRELQRGLQEFIAANHLSNPGMAETAKQTADYRTFLKLAGNGGAGPYYGIYTINQWQDFSDWTEDDPQSVRLNEPCPLTPAMSREEDWKDQFSDFHSPYQGLIAIGTQGCTYMMGLIVTGECSGRVVYLDADGQAPYVVREPDFLSWYERWLDAAWRKRFDVVRIWHRWR